MTDQTIPAVHAQVNSGIDAAIVVDDIVQGMTYHLVGPRHDFGSGPYVEVCRSDVREFIVTVPNSYNATIEYTFADKSTVLDYIIDYFSL